MITDNKNYSVLVVDDDTDLLKSLKTALLNKGYKVDAEVNGERAYQLFLKKKKFDLIVSDIKMPLVSGLTLLNLVREKDKNANFVLMTAFSEIIETKDAHDHGADDFLSKPFKLRDFLEVVGKNIKKKAEYKLDRIEENYKGIEIEEFVSGSKIDYPIFVKLSAYKFIKISDRGEDIAYSRILAYKKKGVDKLFLRKSDYSKYVEMTKNILTALKQKPGAVNKDKKLEFVKNANKLVADSIFANELDENTFKEATEIIQETNNLVTQKNELFELIEKFSRDYEAIFAHSMIVSVFAVMLAKKLNWVSGRNLNLISLGAMFHDIGKKVLPKHLMEKKLVDLSLSDKKEIEKHPIIGAEMLEEMPGVPSEVIQIVLQHHENAMGSGYPNRLGKSSIHPLAKVVSVANEFAIYLAQERGAIEPNLKYKRALKKLFSLKKNYFEAGFLYSFAELFTNVKFIEDEGYE